tara:strand:+ start:144 stop:395 length:252 start_codon:yes stop_codon:yes gene_type:complete
MEQGTYTILLVDDDKIEETSSTKSWSRKAAALGSQKQEWPFSIFFSWTISISSCWKLVMLEILMPGISGLKVNFDEFKNEEVY